MSLLSTMILQQSPNMHFRILGLVFPLILQAVGVHADEMPPQSGVIAMASEPVSIKTTPIKGKIISRTANTGQAVYLNDEIKTGGTSKAQILLKDQSVFNIGPNSTMVIDKFVYDPQKSALNVSIQKGAFKFVSGKIANSSDEAMKVSLPNATIAVRGTGVAGIVDPSGSATVMLLHGTVDVTSVASNSTSTLSKSGWGVQINPAGVISPPAPLPADVSRNIMQTSKVTQSAPAAASSSSSSGAATTASNTSSGTSSSSSGSATSTASSPSGNANAAVAQSSTALSAPEVTNAIVAPASSSVTSSSLATTSTSALQSVTAGSGVSTTNSTTLANSSSGTFSSAAANSSLASGNAQLTSANNFLATAQTASTNAVSQSNNAVTQATEAAAQATAAANQATTAANAVNSVTPANAIRANELAASAAASASTASTSATSFSNQALASASTAAQASASSVTASNSAINYAIAAYQQSNSDTSLVTQAKSLGTQAKATSASATIANTLAANAANTAQASADQATLSSLAAANNALNAYQSALTVAQTLAPYETISQAIANSGALNPLGNVTFSTTNVAMSCIGGFSCGGSSSSATINNHSFVFNFLNSTVTNNYNISYNNFNGYTGTVSGANTATAINWSAATIVSLPVTGQVSTAPVSAAMDVVLSSIGTQNLTKRANLATVYTTISSPLAGGGNAYMGVGNGYKILGK